MAAIGHMFLFMNSCRRFNLERNVYSLVYKICVKCLPPLTMSIVAYYAVADVKNNFPLFKPFQTPVSHLVTRISTRLTVLNLNTTVNASTRW